MRTASGCLAAVALSAAVLAAAPQSGDVAAVAAPQPQAAPPAFRAGVDVVTVDVVVLDSDGRPVTELRPSDFTVRIDGQTRRVLSADLIRLDETGSTPFTPFTSVTTPLPSTAAAARGRRILIAIDQLQIRPGEITPLLAAAARFVDRLTARDQVSVVTFPGPGPRVEFTSDKSRIRQALQGSVGTPTVARTMTYNLGVAEALTIHERESTVLPGPGLDFSDPPTVAEALRRGCTAAPDDGPALDACRQRIVAEASALAQSVRADANISTAAIRSLVEGLAALEGPKSLLLVSAGLLINDPSEIDALARAAEASRTSIHVLSVDPGRMEGLGVDVVPGNQGSRTGEDRRLRLEGLAAISAPGALYQIEGSGDGVFARIASELSAYYLLAVESRRGDEQRAKKVEVAVERRGTRVRSSLAFARVPAAPASRPSADRLGEALASSVAITELAVGLATFARRDAAGDKVRLELAAQIATGSVPRDLDIGYVVLNEANTVVARSGPQRLPPPSATAAIDHVIPVVLDPGAYTVRVGVVDSEGRRGTVVRDVVVERFGGAAVTASDLFVSDGPPTAQSLRPGANLRIRGDQLGAYVELYSSAREDLEWTTIEFEIAASEEGPAVLTESAFLDDSADSSRRVASAVLDIASLPPGGYVVRARAELDGRILATRIRSIVIGGR